MVEETCRFHPDKAVVGNCVNCGRGVCSECAVTVADKTYCKECVSSLSLGPSGEAKYVDWERMKEVGFWKALGKTWFNVIFHPKQFFTNMPITGGLGRPLLFGLIWGSLAIIIAGIINILLQGAGVTPPAVGPEVPPKAVMVTTYIVLIILAPLLVTIGLFVGAGIYHVSVLIFGGRKGFQPTFRVVCYANSISIFNVVPFLGAVFVTVYSIILFCLGFKRAHGISTVKAAFAALLPMIILIVIVFAIGFIVALTVALRGGLPPIPIPGPTP